MHRLHNFVQDGGKPEDCVASPHWLPFARAGEYKFFSVNISPTTEHYGQLYSAFSNDGCDERLWCNSMEEFIEKTVKYIKLRDATFQEILEEDPDISQDELLDCAEVFFGDEAEEEDEEGENEAAEEEEDKSSDEEGEQDE
jgi:hypothetical protein